MRAAAIGRTGLVSSLVLAAASLRAEPRTLSVPAGGDRLVPGAVQEAVWDADAAQPGFDEAELVLSLDGGRTFPIRVSAEIEPGERRAEWRVPDLPTAHARLALRTGREEAAESERIACLSAEFTIAADAAAPPEPLFRFGGEWRTREALAPPPHRAPLSTFAPPVSLTSPVEDVDSDDAPRPAPLAAPVLDPGEPSISAAARPPAPLAEPRGLGSASAPLRL